MAITNGWGQAAKDNTNGYGKLATNNIGAGSIYEDSWAGDTALIGVTAGFSYSKSSYENNEADPTPTITGTAGGTFSAGSGLVFVDSGSNTGSSTGQIDLSATTVAAYTITYTVSGVSSNVSLSVTQGFINDYSFSFDGTDDYIDCTNDSIFNLTTGMTISAWINPTVAVTNKFLVAKRWSTNSYQIATAGSINPQCSVWIGTTRYNASGSTVLSAGTWYHIVGTFDGSNVKVYVDGVLEDTTAASGSLDQTADIVSIAKGVNNNTYNFNGKIDEVAIWNSALGSTAVTQIYNSGTPIALDSDTGNYTSSADLVAWYRMGD